MSDLAKFLLARIAEDEAVARTAWSVGPEWSSWNRSWDTKPVRDLAAGGQRIAALPTTIDEHVCRHDPARVLAECEAKRRIVEDRQRIDRSAGDTDWHSGYSDGNYDAIKALALPYADHPDYREEWRP